jgi:hypothetical protein
MHVSLKMFLSVFLLTAPPAFPQSLIKLSVDAKAARHPINPNIYGIANGVDPAFAQEIKLPNTRWGGDATSRYNWQVDASNSGKDWYFMGGAGVSTPIPGAQVDQMIHKYLPASTTPLITIPIIPFVNKTSDWNCSYPVSLYGAQASVNPYVHPNGGDCGNGVTLNGDQLLDTAVYANHIDNSPDLQKGWMEHLLSTFGKFPAHAPWFFQLDNEPGGWGNTHVDVEPDGATYDTIFELGRKYAAMVKAAHPPAQILGPSDFTHAGWVGTGPDQAEHNGLYSGQWYLKKMAAYEKRNGVRLLDYFDEHYYPTGGSGDQWTLDVTRSLWDPTYNSGSWFEQYYGSIQLIPRFKSWINDYYPGTKLAISEYSFGPNTGLVNALAQADVLGIFGREGADFANLWTIPDPAQPVAYSFRLFRNYDGQGSEFGDIGISSTSTDQSQLAIYGAIRRADHSLTLLVINKTLTAMQTGVSLANFHPANTAETFSYSAANLNAIVPGASLPVDAQGFSTNFPARSATMIVLPGAEPN